MTDTTNTNMTNTNETAAAVEETAVAETSPATAASPATENPISATLPSGYLASGSMVDADGVMLPEYIGEYAEALAKGLKPIKASAFYGAFLREAKNARKKKVPYAVQKNCALGMVTAAKKLVARKKDPAPALLLEMIARATATVTDSSTFEALYMHLDAVYSYMLGD